MATGPGLAMKMTADTVGISRGITKTEKMLLDLSKSTKRATSALRGLVAIEIGKMFTSAVTSISGFIDKVRESAGELTRLAAVSNTSIEAFQGMAAAAATLGIQQDKLADIFKDMNDRVGDFLQTGGGPMADFFENIAPLVGLTADSFRDLSGPEALQLYVNALQQAGLSQAEMVFYLEAISSDLTVLLPLLQDGGAGFQELAERAERLGIVLSEDQTDAIKEMNGALYLVEATIQGIIGQVTANLAPAITAIAEEFLQFVEGYQGLGEGTGGTALADSITTALFDGAEYLADLLDSAIASLSEWGVNVENSFAGLQATFEFFYTAVTFLNDAFFFVRSVFNDFLAGAAEWSAKFVSYFSSAGAEFLNNYAQIMRQQAEQDRQRISAPGSPTAQQNEGMFGGAVRTGRSAYEQSRSPEAKAERERERAAREAERQQADAARKENKRQEEARKQEERDAKAREDYEKKIASKRNDLAVAEFQYAIKNAEDLAAVNQKALTGTDIRTGGIDQVLALATGREDPAVTESRKQLKELQAMRMELAALKALPVEIMGAA